MRTHICSTIAVVLIHLQASMVISGEPWVIDSQEDWTKQVAEQSGVEIKDGAVSPKSGSATLKSAFRKFPKKQAVHAITFEQSPTWQNWNPIENVGPSNLFDAPVALSLGPDNYWMFGRYGGGAKAPDGSKAKAFSPEPATLEGFDMPLQTTRFAHQYNAPGGLNRGRGGYHAWQSKDMVNWVHHGAITERDSAWMTTAEYADGVAYFYYDFPNDQDPHLFMDDDLFDGQPGNKMGVAFRDPSHGSDAGIIRDLNGAFHLILEDWSPIKAQVRSWDSPLASHAVSPDGISGFVLRDPPVDERTTPTGKIGTYKHPHWVNEDPEHFKTNVAEYEIHSPEQNAYGDWAPIAIGGRYYLFGDFDPAGGHKMSACWFTSDSIDKQFTFCDHVGEGHPDPDICFAEGQFYLVTQMDTDYVSPGPWVDGVEVRVGVDTTGDGAADRWTDWASVSESYDYTPGFAKQIKRTPASLDLTTLPRAFGMQFELKLTDTTDNKSKPVLDRVTVAFEE